MLHTLTPEQFDEWQAACELDPFGNEYDDGWYQTATLAAILTDVGKMTIAAIRGADLTDFKATDPELFRPKRQRQTQRVTTTDQPKRRVDAVPVDVEVAYMKRRYSP